MRMRIGIATVVLFLAGCLSPHRSVMTDTRPTGWGKEVEIAFDNEDTVSRQDLCIVLRYNEQFRGDSLRLTVCTITPDTICYEEPFTLFVPRRAHPAPLRDEISVTYRRNVVLSKAGEYRMTFTPMTRVSGVEAIGINLEKTE